jgi:microcystin-dependent protein
VLPKNWHSLILSVRLRGLGRRRAPRPLSSVLAPGRRSAPRVESLELRTLMASTGSSGSGAPFNNTQPSLALRYIIDLNSGVYPGRGGNGTTADSFIGQIDLMAGIVVPGGWAVCNGQEVSISTFYRAFHLLGTTYGGNGTTTFRVPNLQDRAVVGVGTGEGLPDRPLATSFGSDLATLSLKELPPHSHPLPGGGVSGVTGAGEPFDKPQPSLALNYVISPSGLPGFAQLRLFAGDFAPDGFLLCDGQILEIARHPKLFGLLGTTYGGNGTTTFALPDLRGRLDIGTGQIAGGSLRTLGEKSGSAAIRLTEAQLPPHTHTLPNGGGTGTTGGGQPFDNTHPSLGMNYMIATSGVFPSEYSVQGNAGGSTPYLGEVDAFPAGGPIPGGWALANGQILSIDQNRTLFSIMGPTYGGNGITTFALPNLSGRVPVGAGMGQTNRWLGDAFGSQRVTLTVSQIPSHAHD